MTKVSPDEAGSVTLLKEEGSLHAYTGAVTTITFFTGPAPVEAVRERLTAVVAANPWLAGRLVRGKGEKRMQLTFDPAGPLRDGIFTVASPGQYKAPSVPAACLRSAAIRLRPPQLPDRLVARRRLGRCRAFPTPPFRRR